MRPAVYTLSLHMAFPAKRTQKYRRWFVCAILCALTSFIQVTTGQIAHAGRPLVIDDAAPIPPAHLEIEFGLAHARPHGGGREQASPVISIGYGLIQNFEIGLSIQRANHDVRGYPPRKGFEDVHLVSKFRISEETEHLPAAAFSLDVKTPTASKSLSTKRFEEALILALSKAYAPLGLHLNGGYVLVESSRDAKLKNRIRAGLAADYAVNPNFVLVAEVFGASRPADHAKNEAAFHLGLRHSVSSDFVVDAAAGRSFRASGSSFQATAGLTWTINILALLKI